MTELKQTPHVLVVGAGITGLLIAQGLKKNGIKCTVFEREPSAQHYRQREWGMSVHWALPFLKDCLPPELVARQHEGSVDPSYHPSTPESMPILNGATGEMLKDMPMPFMYRMSRRQFRSLVAEGIEVQYDKALADITFDDDGATVTAKSTDGSKYAGNHLIGTDGANSVVRTMIFGAEEAQALRMPYSAINLHVRYNDTEKAKFARQAHPIAKMGIHPDGYWLWLSIQEVPDPKDPTTWVFQLQTTWKKKDDDEDVTSLAAQKKRASTFAEPFRSANLWIPEGTKVFQNSISYWIPKDWDTKNGRILLAGDAAHPMSFQRGQGLNHGITDAAKISNEFLSALEGNKSYPEAVDSYKIEMIERAGTEVMVSKRNTEAIHDWTQFMNSPLMVNNADANKT